MPLFYLQNACVLSVGFMKRFLICFCLFLCFGVFSHAMAYADEVQYAGIQLDVPAEWVQTDEKVFSGSSPSEARVFARGEEEVVFGAIVTEGVSEGLVDVATTVLIRSYVEAFAISWGAKVTGPKEGELAAYCGGEAGYHLEAAFGNDIYDYYGCMLIRADKWRAATVVTWVKRDGAPDPEGRALLVATKRLMPFLKAIRFEPVSK